MSSPPCTENSHTGFEEYKISPERPEVEIMTI